jgi:hypothetical protein
VGCQLLPHRAAAPLQRNTAPGGRHKQQAQCSKQGDVGTTPRHGALCIKQQLRFLQQFLD